MREIKWIILHESRQARPGHVWHYFIKRDGQTVRLCPLSLPGRHCRGYNMASIALCLERSNRGARVPKAQRLAYEKLVAALKADFPGVTVLPHSAFWPVDCPGGQVIKSLLL